VPLGHWGSRSRDAVLDRRAGFGGVVPAILTAERWFWKGPCDLWCDLAACFWHFWYFENFASCITYVFSV
jgi:hypothetical protein